MKRLTAGLLALMLLATLLPGCGKKEQWNVDNFFLSDDGATYSVSYRHDDGTEEVVAEMGSYPQPLTIIAGKLYYVHGGSMVAVDLKDPTQRQTITEPGLPVNTRCRDISVVGRSCCRRSWYTEAMLIRLWTSSLTVCRPM